MILESQQWVAARCPAFGSDALVCSFVWTMHQENSGLLLPLTKRELPLTEQLRLALKLR